ncbi:hypothetical protein [Brevundimonas lenta]|uniref:Uncharacterized protein n=1 Tax=Brevundimonas lenta TaxID=424796 RepID=A0A7W6JH40_9CAUL|nr:hypothetical protein [Brevundimonas lenta]MBB4084058.1 hypothetical protein [Brevundimonas lenta]
MRRLLIVAACLMAAACASATESRTATLSAPPAAAATVVLIKPDVDLAVLTAVGLSETRADWSELGASNLQTALQNRLGQSSQAVRVVDPDMAMEGRASQLMRLHQAVGASILVFDYGPRRLPTKTGFDWTLGDGAGALDPDADYALFTSARGTYASGGRMATMVVMAAFGMGVPLGEQQILASLVELKTGRVIWFNHAIAGPHADIRSPEGATALVSEMMKDAPL